MPIGVRGNYDAIERPCTECSSKREAWAFVNVNVRPYYAEGSKTLAYETAEQLGWEIPDRVVAPIASGSLFTKVARSFQEFIDAGLVRGAIPAMHGAQAESCSPVAQAFAAGTDVCRPVKPDTIAKSLAIGNPADSPYAVEIRPPHRRLGRRGLRRRDPRRHPAARRDRRASSPRPPAASPRRCWRSWPRAARWATGERVVAYITGDGLKTLDCVRGTFEVAEIEPRFEAFEDALGALV